VPPDPAPSRPVLEAARRGAHAGGGGGGAGASVRAAVLAGGAPVVAVVGVWRVPSMSDEGGGRASRF
jgi:hypothetical protein